MTEVTEQNLRERHVSHPVEGAYLTAVECNYTNFKSDKASAKKYRFFNICCELNVNRFLIIQLLS